MTGQPEEELGIGQVGSSSWSTSGKNDFKGGISSHSKKWELKKICLSVFRGLLKISNNNGCESALNTAKYYTKCQAIEGNDLNCPCPLTLNQKISGSVVFPLSRNFRQ